MKNKEYIQNKQKQSNHFNISNIEVIVKNPLANNVSARETVTRLTNIVPKKLLGNIKGINIGSHRELEKRELQALYKDSTIYVTNIQKSNEDLLDDLVHEVAHSVEEMYSDHIYGDKRLESEFLTKRKELWRLIRDRGFKMELNKFLDPLYSKEFDLFLYKGVGYPLLAAISSNIFYSPYAATSLREYFANGFESFFLKEETYRLKKISPILYQKIQNLL